MVSELQTHTASSSGAAQVLGLTKELVEHALRHVHLAAAHTGVQKRCACLSVWLHACRALAHQLDPRSSVLQCSG